MFSIPLLKKFGHKFYLIGLLILLFNSGFSANYLFNYKNSLRALNNQEINLSEQNFYSLQPSNFPIHGSSTENEENYECECQKESSQDVINSYYENSIRCVNCAKSAKLFAFNSQILNCTITPLYLLFHSLKIFLF